MDRQLRELERLAATGDLEAKARLGRLRNRIDPKKELSSFHSMEVSGRVTDEEYTQLVVSRDSVLRNIRVSARTIEEPTELLCKVNDTEITTPIMLHTSGVEANSIYCFNRYLQRLDRVSFHIKGKASDVSITMELINYG